MYDLERLDVVQSFQLADQQFERVLSVVVVDDEIYVCLQKLGNHLFIWLPKQNLLEEIQFSNSSKMIVDRLCISKQFLILIAYRNVEQNPQLTQFAMSKYLPPFISNLNSINNQQQSFVNN